MGKKGEDLFFSLRVLSKIIITITIIIIELSGEQNEMIE